MSFSPDWLALREPADAAARDRGLAAELARWSAARAQTLGRPARIWDLGCGSGATFRALAPLAPDLDWTLIDQDEALLDLAQTRTGARVRRLDLAGAPDLAAAGAGEAPEIIAASALFDLVSAPWMTRFVAALPPHVAVYAALSYDGRETWSPTPPHEAQGLAAFHAHQTSDKGFGVSLGPSGGAALAAGLAQRGWKVRIADSAWRLGPESRALIEALADGAAKAVAETGALSGRALADWRIGRARARQVEIGHMDMLALPPEE